MIPTSPALLAALPLLLPSPQEPGPTGLAVEVAEPSTTGPELHWPQWRGPARDGSCQGPDWPEALEQGRLELQWRVPDLGPSYAGPLIVGERVFSVETLEEEVEVVRAFDRASGEELWHVEWEGAMQVPFFAARNGSWVRSTPACDGERLYVAGMRDVLVCLDAASGEELWRVDFVERFGTDLPAFGFVCSPLVHGEHVYVQAGGAFVQLDRRTGEPGWTTLDGAKGMDSAFSSPVWAELAGVPQLVVQTREELCGVRPGDGEVLWSRPIKAFRGMNILTPTVLGDSVFTSAYGGRSLLLDVSLAGGDEPGWSTSERWDTGAQGYMTSPVVHEGHAYMFLRSNRFNCIRLSDGEVVWTSPPTGDEYWSLVSQGDRILALANDGELILLEATPEEYRELGRAVVSEMETWAHLAVVGDTVYVREQEALSAHRWR